MPTSRQPGDSRARHRSHWEAGKSRPDNFA
jgi:hypothetical protein